MAFHDGFADCQAKAATAFGPGARLIGPVKALKNMRNIFSRNALSAIGNGQNCATVFAAGADENLAIRFVVVDGIGEKIGDELAKAVGVAESLSGAEVAVNFDATLFGKRADASDTDARAFRQIDSAPAYGFLAGIEARELEQGFGEPSSFAGRRPGKPRYFPGTPRRRVRARGSSALQR